MLRSPVLRLSVRVAVAAGLTGYLLWKSHPRAVLAAGAGATWGPMAVAAALVGADRVLMAYRWLVLLCVVDPAARPPFTDVMRIFFVSTFVGTFLPASVGGDAVRAYSLARLKVDGGDAVASVFMDRMLGVASVLIMALVGLGLARDLAGNVAIVLSLAVTTALCVATMLLIFSSAMSRLVSAIVNWLPSVSVQNTMRRILESIRRYAKYRRQLVNVLASSIAVQVLRVIQAYYLGRGLGIDVSLVTYFAFIPLILLAMLLPVTFNGIGTSQAAFLWFFGQAGVPAASAFALSVLFVALGIIGNLPGALLYIVGGTRISRSAAS
ncbi:MAG: lysylphosphatidylglycerol synthase transmembrane domain-containing protein [Acidobacteriota bacterium]